MVLPIRFASISPDDSAVTTALAEHADHLLERLRVLDGKTEYNLKASHNEEAVLRLVVAANDEIRSLAQANREAGGGANEDQVRLGELVAGALQAREAADAELLHQELTTAAEAVSTGPPSTGWPTSPSSSTAAQQNSSWPRSVNSAGSTRTWSSASTARYRPTASSTPRDSTPTAAPRKHSKRPPTNP